MTMNDSGHSKAAYTNNTCLILKYEDVDTFTMLPQPYQKKESSTLVKKWLRYTQIMLPTP